MPHSWGWIMPEARLTSREPELRQEAPSAATAQASAAAVPPRSPIALAARPAPARHRGTWMVAMAGLLALLAYGGHQLFWGAPIYETEIRFAVRQAEAPRLQPAPGLFGAGMLTTVTESHAVVQYLRSRDALQGLEERLPLRSMLGRPEVDSRVPADATPEALLRQMPRFVRAHFDHLSGIITVQVRAFSAEDALALALAVEALAEELVNRMSLGARRGLLAAVEREAAEGEARLSRLRDELRALREATAQLDAHRSAIAADQLRARLETEIADQRVQLARMLRFQGDDAPAVRQQRERIEALEAELREQIRRALGRGDETLAAALRRHEALESEIQTAQRSQEALIATLERTRSDANRQQIYLAHIVRPALPGSFDRLARWRNVATAAGLGLLGGLLLLLVARTIREHFT